MERRATAACPGPPGGCAGKVVYLGIRNTPAWRVAELQTLADLRGWAPLMALQIEYSLVERTVEHELLPMAAALGLGVLPWSPLGGGVLTGKYGRADLATEGEAGVSAPRWSAPGPYSAPIGPRPPSRRL